jgi:hypothetical protein
LTPELLDAIRAIAPKPRHPKLPYVVVLALLTVGGALGRDRAVRELFSQKWQASSLVHSFGDAPATPATIARRTGQKAAAASSQAPEPPRMAAIATPLPPHNADVELPAVVFEADPPRKVSRRPRGPRR